MSDWINDLSYFQWLIVNAGVSIVVFIACMLGANAYFKRQEARAEDANEAEFDDWCDQHFSAGPVPDWRINKDED